MEQLKNNITDIVKEKNDYIIKGKLRHLTEEVEDLKLVLIDEKEKASFIRLVDHTNVDGATLEYQVSLNIDHIDSKLRKHNIDISTHSFYLHITFVGSEDPLVLAAVVEPQNVENLFNTVFEKPYGLALRYLSFRCDDKGILKLVSHVYSKENASYLRDRAPMYRYLGNRMSREKIILFGGHSPLEKTFNTWNFFTYLRRNHPDINAYYILDRTAPFFEDAVREEGDRILVFRSREYINKILQASLIVTDKAPENFYPTGTLAFKKYINAEHWLLPAAPFGMTNEKYTLNEKGASTYFSKIFMNSRSEIRFTRDTFDVDSDRMELTGLPASSYLIKHRDESYENQTLFILPYIDFPHIASDETEKALSASLLRNKGFRDFLKESNLSVVIALPEEMIQEKGILEELGATVVNNTEEEIIKNLQEARLLITDYHPHALTYSVLNRAIIFYQGEYRPSIGEDFYFESYQNELPGDIATSEEDLLYLLKEYSEDNFKMKAPFVKKTNLLFEHQDDSVYERIFEHFEEI